MPPLLPDQHPPVVEPQTGLLLVNLGTPASLQLVDIKGFLREFLSDRRVIDYPAWLWQPILRCILLNVRPAKARKAYEAIWRRESDESPLRYYTRRQAELMQQRLQGQLVVNWAMTYGQPNINTGMTALLDAGCRRILILPLYPQFSATTTTPVYDRVFASISGLKWQPAIRIVNTWHDESAFIQASAEHLREQLAALPFKPEALLLSFHGLPFRYLTAGDPYHCFCQKSARLIAQTLNRPDIHTETSFQSRFGPGKWLQPATDSRVRELVAQGMHRLAVFSPGFVSDCVETLEELGIQLRATFESSGGQEFAALPCLNDSDLAIDMLEIICRRELAGWLTA